MWEKMQGQMKQLGGKLKEKWAKLTDDDLLLLEGKKEVFLGKLQERTGLVRDEAEKQLDAFIANFRIRMKPLTALDKAVATLETEPKID